MQVVEPPAADAAPLDDPLVRRGAQHVRMGLALDIVGTLALVIVTATGDGQGQAIGVSGWLGALLTQFLVVAAVLSANRVARFLVLTSGAIQLFAASALLLVDISGANHMMPSLTAFAFCLGASGIGSLLATATKPARAWFNARRAMFAARRQAKTLSEWRRAD